MHDPFAALCPVHMHDPFAAAFPAHMFESHAVRLPGSENDKMYIQLRALLLRKALDFSLNMRVSRRIVAVKQEYSTNMASFACTGFTKLYLQVDGVVQALYSGFSGRNEADLCHREFQREAEGRYVESDLPERQICKYNLIYF